MTSEYLYAAQCDNLQAMTEINEREKYLGKTVEVVKGKKDIGFVGTVFWLKRTHYGKNSWTGWSTRVGIKSDDGSVVWSNTNNIALV